MRLRVIYEDNHLLAVAKPAGLATMGAAPGVSTLVDHAKSYLKEKYNKPGEVYLGVVSRLDSPVTGLVLFARTSKAAARLTDAFRTRRVEKLYLATVAGEPEAEQAVLRHWLRKDERRRRMHATHEGAEGAKQAELSYQVLLRRDGGALLAVRPVTGRKHQIRVQLAKEGLPLVGDEKYDGPASSEPGVALHSWRLELEHPVRREPLELEAVPPGGWARWPSETLEPALTRYSA